MTKVEKEQLQRIIDITNNDDLEVKWNVLKEGINKAIRIIEGKGDKFEAFEYTLLRTIVHWMFQKKVDQYTIQSEAFQNYIKDVLLPALTVTHDEFMLKKLVDSWKKYCLFIKWMCRFYSIFESESGQSYRMKNKLPSVSELGSTCFKEHVFKRLKLDILSAVTKVIENEREGDQIDRTLLKNVADIFIEMGSGHIGVYEADLEACILLETGNYYKRKAASWIVDNSFPDYMSKIEECLKREEENASHYLHASSQEKLLAQVREMLLVQYHQVLLEKEGSGFRELLRGNKVDDLSRLKRLYSKVPNGMDLVAKSFEMHIKEEGLALVKEAEQMNPAKREGFIGKLIELNERYLQCAVECFASEVPFQKAQKAAFMIFCNKSVPTTELLVAFCDDILKKSGIDSVNDEYMENTLGKTVRLVHYVDDKDMFEEIYRKKLARRLILQKTTQVVYEQTMLALLSKEFGAQFTRKMENMLNDVSLVPERKAEWEEYLRAHPQSSPGVDLTVTTVTTGYWPRYPTSQLALPQELAECVDSYNTFYREKTRNRKLTWIHSLGTCNVTGKFQDKEIEIVISPYQAACLVLFNDVDKLSYNDILTQMKLPSEDIDRVLQSLSSAKYKILSKYPLTDAIGKEDIFEFNSKFTNSKRKIRIPLPPARREKEVVEGFENRKYVIEACIIRIMKSRKVLGYMELVAECIEQLSGRFKPDVQAIKQRIEDLILRDFLEREEGQFNIFHYID